MIFPIDFEHVPVDGIKLVRILERNTKSIPITLTGRLVDTPSSLNTKSIPITLTGRLVDTPSSLPPQHQSPPNPNEFILKYPHSNTGSSRSTVSQSPPIRGNEILPVHTVSFRDTVVKDFGGTYTLDFNNECIFIHVHVLVLF